MATTRLLGISALLLSLFSSAAPAQETSRDAFIEGWFLETAEGDLEGALKQYRLAIKLGGAEDRPLMAKAALRMARIAKARGDQEAWRAQLEQLAQLYPGTEAAEQAALDLERPDVAEVDAATATYAARADLIEMLHDGENSANTRPEAPAPIDCSSSPSRPTCFTSITCPPVMEAINRFPLF